MSLSGIGQSPSRGVRGGCCRGGGGEADPPSGGGGGGAVERFGGELPPSRDGADRPEPLSAGGGAPCDSLRTYVARPAPVDAASARALEYSRDVVCDAAVSPPEAVGGA